MKTMEFPAQYRIQGWGISLLLHAAIVSLVLMAMANVNFIPKQEIFRWEVAVVETPAQPAPAASPSEPQPTPAPQPPAKTKASPPVDAQKPNVTRRIETKEVVESVRPQPAPPTPLERQVVERKPVEQVHPVKPADSTPVETAVPRPVETPQTYEQQRVVQERKAMEDKAVPLTTPPPQEVAAIHKQEPVAAAMPQEASPATKEVTTREVAAVESSQPIQKKIVEAEESSPTPTPAPIAQEKTAVESPPPVSREVARIQENQPVPSPPAVPRADISPPVETQASPPTPSGSTPAPQRNDTTSPVPTQPAEPVREQAPAGTAVAKAYPTPRADFGWLTQALWRRIEQLKRYPHKARMNRWEGTVVVRCVIRQDGYFAELTMEKSSGHNILDEDAIELLRKASPLSLKHELGRPELTIRIPISYKLE
ncbi:MAG TPA: TonB family protein [Nitrospiraceae bacterium]|nr:TonB family protein [Nitrospiraceae bacterium]